MSIAAAPSEYELAQSHIEMSTRIELVVHDDEKTPVRLVREKPISSNSSNPHSQNLSNAKSQSNSSNAQSQSNSSNAQSSSNRLRSSSKPEKELKISETGRSESGRSETGRKDSVSQKDEFVYAKMPGSMEGIGGESITERSSDISSEGIKTVVSGEGVKAGKSKGFLGMLGKSAKEPKIKEQKVKEPKIKEVKEQKNGGKDGIFGRLSRSSANNGKDVSGARTKVKDGNALQPTTTQESLSAQPTQPAQTVQSVQPAQPNVPQSTTQTTPTSAFSSQGSAQKSTTQPRASDPSTANGSTQNPQSTTKMAPQTTTKAAPQTTIKVTPQTTTKTPESNTPRTTDPRAQPSASQGSQSTTQGKTSLGNTPKGTQGKTSSGSTPSPQPTTQPSVKGSTATQPKTQGSDAREGPKSIGKNGNESQKTASIGPAPGSSIGPGSTTTSNTGGSSIGVSNIGTSNIGPTTFKSTAESTGSSEKQDEETLNDTSKDTETQQPSENEFKEIAVKLYNEDFVSIVPEEYTQFLAAQDADSAMIREYYMDLFQWDVSLIKSTRMLCSKLYLKGESQEIDRILSAFTKSYVKQHPSNVFCTGDFEKIYIVLYSLILLNTALHNSEVSRKSKISQSDYIKNTFTTFLSQNKKAARNLSVKQKIQIERELNSYYEDLAKNELYLKKGDASSPKRPNTNRYSITETIRSTVSAPQDSEAPSSPRQHARPQMGHDLSRQPSNTSTWSVDNDGFRRSSLGMARMNSGGPHAGNAGKNSRFGFTRALLSEANTQRSGANTLRNHKSVDHLRQVTRRSSRASIITKESARGSDEDALSMVSVDQSGLYEFVDAEENTGPYEIEDFDISDFQDQVDLKLELQGSPYLKEGLLKLRILNNDMADSASGSDSTMSSAASTTSTISKPGFFSFFNRSGAGKEQATTLGTNTAVFSNKMTEYFVVVSKGELRLYSFDPKVIKKHQQKMKKAKKNNLHAGLEQYEEQSDDVGDGNWLNNAANIGNYNLCATNATLVKSPAQGSQGNQGAQKGITWTLEFPKVSWKPQKKFVFEAGTLEIASEFVHTCNFWASKLTAVPTLEESVSSIEYGWNNLNVLIANKDSFKKAKHISRWETLPKGVYLSNYVSSEGEYEDSLSHEGMSKQFTQTLRYYNTLKGHFNQFNQCKREFMIHFRKLSNCSNYKLVMDNFEARASEYKAELSKYKNYIVMLGYGLKLRFDLEELDDEEKWMEEIAERSSIQGEEAIEEEIKRRRVEMHASESELTKSVKKEIQKLMQCSNQLNELLGHEDEHTAEYRSDESTDYGAFLVKSPKTFSLSNFKDSESSPINQLLSADNKNSRGDYEQSINFAKKELIMSFSTNTIREEDEPED